MKSIPFVFLLALVGCTSSSQGVRLRAQSPSIDEAFRKLSLAVNVDGYEIERIEPSTFLIETKWREAKEQEKFATQRLTAQQVKLSVQLARRGQMYDVVVAPSIQESDSTIAIVDPSHPMIVKWRRIINSIVQKENREED